MLTLALIVFLLAANAFFVAAEFALVKVRDIRLDEMADQGSGAAALVRHMRRQIEAYLAACQLGITMASLGLGWVGEPFVAHLLQPVFAVLELPVAVIETTSFLLGFLIFSALHIVLGEQVPKTFAIRTPEAMARWIAWPLHLFHRLLYPLTWLLNEASRGCLRLLGVGEAGDSEAVSSQELRGILTISRAHGAVEKQDYDMLGAVLDLEEIEVGHIMTHRSDMTTLDADMPIAEVVSFVRKSPYTRYPVWKGDPDQIVGILHAKDLLSLADGEGRLQPGADIQHLLSAPWFIPDTTSLQQQLLAFRQRRVHLALVVDEYGTLMGLVTLEDIIEEIVGEIADEKDVEVSGIEAQPDGSAIVDGRIAIRDVNRRFDWRLPDEEAATVAGLVMHVARRIPDTGESVEIDGFRIEVVVRERHHLQRLRVTPVARSVT